MVNKIRIEMRFFLFLIVFFIFCSCSTTIIVRPEIRGTIYDITTKVPIEKAHVYIDDTIIISDENGKFIINSIKKRTLFNYESGHDPMLYLIKLEHPNYNSVNIEKRTRGSFSENLIVYDSIFLELKKN